jgi:hypothetical protein
MPTTPNWAVPAAVVKDFVKVGAVNEIGSAAKKLNRSLFAKRALGAEHCHALWGFKGQASRHDFTPDGRNVLVLQRTRIGLGDFVDHLGHAVGAKERRAFGALDFAHKLCHFGAVVDQLQQLFVKRIDLHAQGGEGLGLNRWLAHVLD